MFSTLLLSGIQKEHVAILSGLPQVSDEIENTMIES